MKGGLYFIYTSLLTTLVLSSCALFILVVSEVLQTDDEVKPGVDLSGLHNVSQKVSSVSDKDVEPKLPLENYQDTPKDQSNLQEQEVTFADTLSLNSVTTDGLPDTGQPAILISLTDNAKLDLKSPDELFFVNDSEQHNDSKTFTLVDSGGGLEEDKDKKGDDKDKESVEPLLVVKAKPMTENRQIEDAFQTTAAPIEEAITESQTEDQKKQERNIPVKTETPQEDIPSFSEWAQKQLAEAEKDTVLNHSSQPSHSNTNISSKSTKLRSKNYASPACGAKIVAVNPEAGSASSILSPNRDEYMLNTCNSRIWFVVELCEAVQAQKIEIANFELFSSIPKDIAVFFSDRFPTRDWASVGQFTAKEIRDIQSFDLFPHLFGKFIKVEMLSHHGSEHYCPISLFKVYGTSEFEVLEKENSQHTAHIDDDDDEIIDVLDVPTAEKEPSKNLFGSARDAVMSIMKKAAQALVKTEVPKNVSSEHNDTSSDKMYKRCCSPSHIIVCDNCSETLYNQVYELISCSSDKLTNLVRTVFLRETLKCTQICRPYGLDFKSTKTLEFSEERVNYINALFPPKYLAALCNILAIKEKKVVLNTSFETETNVTANITIDEGPPKVTSETNPKQEIITLNTNTSTDEKINDTIPSEQMSEGIEEKKEAMPVEPTKEEIDKTIDKKDEPSVTPEESASQEQKENIAKKGKEDAPKKKDLLPDTDITQGDAKSESESKDMPKPDNKNGKIDGATEKPKENVNVVDEMGEQIIIDSDSFISELDQIAVDPTPAGASATPSQNQAQTIQKESVFLRLSNRVKTLERNMSLSGQYLEELSRRYKKQVEEMQKTFEKTVQQMTEERRKSNEREQKYLEQMSNLQEQLAQMTAAISVLMEDRDSWFGNVTFIKFVVFQVIIVCVVLYYVTKRKKPDHLIVPMSRRAKKKQEKLRRKSVEGVSGHETPSAKKRRPSEEALQIARHSTEDTIREEEGEWQIAKKNRRRKTSIVHRDLDSAISLDYAYNLGSRVNWGRQDSIGELKENPIPLDEEEFIAPVPEPTEFVSNVQKKDLPKTNGSIFNNLKPKAMKTRRLSSPAFLRTFSRQSTRSTPSPVVRSLEPIFNGKSKKKSSSESPTGSLWSQSTELSQNGHSDETGRSKKRKSLKNIFKKVF